MLWYAKEFDHVLFLDPGTYLGTHIGDVLI